MLNKRKIGSEFEEIAANYLVEQGYEILERNYKDRYGEIDIIACHGNCIVFVEVKYRKSHGSGDPAESVCFQKQRRIRQTAAFYIYSKKLGPDPFCRFDVIAILGSKIRHIPNAF